MSLSGPALNRVSDVPEWTGSKQIYSTYELNILERVKMTNISNDGSVTETRTPEPEMGCYLILILPTELFFSISELFWILFCLNIEFFPFQAAMALAGIAHLNTTSAPESSKSLPTPAPSVVPQIIPRRHVSQPRMPAMSPIPEGDGSAPGSPVSYPNLPSPNEEKVIPRETTFCYGTLENKVKFTEQLPTLQNVNNSFPETGLVPDASSPVGLVTDFVTRAEFNEAIRELKEQFNNTLAAKDLKYKEDMTELADRLEFFKSKLQAQETMLSEITKGKCTGEMKAVLEKSGE
jgi:hypothetical protein